MHQVILAFKMEKRRGGKGYSVLIHNFEDVISSLAEEVDVLLYLKTDKEKELINFKSTNNVSGKTKTRNFIFCQ